MEDFIDSVVMEILKCRQKQTTLKIILLSKFFLHSVQD